MRHCSFPAAAKYRGGRFGAFLLHHCLHVPRPRQRHAEEAAADAVERAIFDALDRFCGDVVEIEFRREGREIARRIRK
jgi:hypothetical protein